MYTKRAFGESIGMILQKKTCFYSRERKRDFVYDEHMHRRLCRTLMHILVNAHNLLLFYSMRRKHVHAIYMEIQLIKNDFTLKGLLSFTRSMLVGRLQSCGCRFQSMSFWNFARICFQWVTVLVANRLSCIYTMQAVNINRNHDL